MQLVLAPPRHAGRSAQPTVLALRPLQYLFAQPGRRGMYCLGLYDNKNDGTLLGMISVRDVLVQVRTAVHLPACLPACLPVCLWAWPRPCLGGQD
jgi:hypothetical protein